MPTVTLGIKTLSNTSSVTDQKLSPTDYKSLPDISKTSLLIIHSNQNADSAGEEVIFKAPNILKRKSQRALVRPKIHIYMANGNKMTVQQAHATQMVNDPNPHLLKIPALVTPPKNPVVPEVASFTAPKKPFSYFDESFSPVHARPRSATTGKNNNKQHKERIFVYPENLER